MLFVMVWLRANLLYSNVYLYLHLLICDICIESVLHVMNCLFSEEENGEFYSCMNLTQMDCCDRTVKCV